MNSLLTNVSAAVREAFAAAGYDEKYAMASVSNRPDLCDYQSNGAMAAAKAYHKAPIVIAEEIVAAVLASETGKLMFEKVEAVKPGFINLTLRPSYLSSFAEYMYAYDDLGVEKAAEPEMVIVDYGGANIAKPLHVGHLRPAIIGESVKRILQFAGHKVIGDVHMGDWGMPMGLVITEKRHRNPELVYFDENYEGEYPEEAPFTVAELEEIYPTASAKSKEDPEYHAEALQAVLDLQNGRRGYVALWNQIMKVSVADLKKNYGNLNVSFELWKGESDAAPYIDDMLAKMEADGFAHESQGALVVDIAEEGDKKELPPCIVRKSDGAALYATTDLATLVEREQLYHPDQVIYVVDKRQELHFTQVFRVAKKTGIIPQETKLTFIGFGTMNGKDGKPFKTRDGGVMRLEQLTGDIEAEVRRKMENRDMPEEELAVTAKQVGLAALKYGDLSNQASKDYVFDLERFASFEGNTGPYIQYTVVRIRSILEKYRQELGVEEAEFGQTMHDACILPPMKTGEDGAAVVNDSEREMELVICRFADMVRQAAGELAPHKVCQYIFELSNALNHFYHENYILSEADEEKKKSYLKLIALCERVLVKGLDLLGIEAPKHM